jgi:hypothetical protein
MGKLKYNGQRWIGILEHERGFIRVSMSDAIFQKHLNAHLERLGIPTKTYLEFIQEVQEVLEQRYRAVEHITNLDYWLACNDPDIQIYRSFAFVSAEGNNEAH